MLPRRGVIAIASTALGLALLLSFKTTPAPGLGRGASVVAVSPAGGTGGAPPASLFPANAGAPPGQAAADQGGTGQPGGSAPTPPAATPTPAVGAAANGTVTGQVVDTPYGPVQVAVTLSGGRIADVRAIQLPNDRMRSAMISQYVAPLLRSEALSAQSASIDLVSGATYTSEGYAQSLQSALDQSHG